MKRIVLTAIALIVFITGAILCLRSILSDDPEPTATPEAPIFTPAPAPTDTPEPTPTPTPTPTPRPTPTPTPAPTPAPTPTPEPAAVSGSFRSDSGTKLNLLVTWSAYPSAGGGYRLEVDVNAESYSFSTDALYHSIAITIGDETYALNSPKVSYDGTDLAVTPLAAQTAEVPGGAVPISVVWNYKGSYSGVEIESITASGTAQLP